MSQRANRPIVLLHGCGGSRRATFGETGWIDAIASRGRVAVALDLPGHGRIPAPHDPQRYADLAGLVASDLPEGPFDIVGFSLGAKIALELAIRYPERIGRMVLAGVGDNVFAPERVADAAARALEAGPTSDTPEPIRIFLRHWEPQINDALAVAAVLRRPPNPTFTSERLSGVKAPVLIVNGELDPVAQTGTALISSLGDVRCVSLPGSGHFDLPSQPGFLTHALEFLITQRETE